jgi:hypothetical protein
MVAGRRALRVVPAPRPTDARPAYRPVSRPGAARRCRGAADRAAVRFSSASRCCAFACSASRATFSRRWRSTRFASTTLSRAINCSAKWRFRSASSRSSRDRAASTASGSAAAATCAVEDRSNVLITRSNSPSAALARRRRGSVSRAGSMPIEASAPANARLIRTSGVVPGTSLNKP